MRGERGGGEGSCRWNYNEKAYFFHGLTKLNFKIKVIFVFFTFVFQFWPKISHWIWYFIWLKLVLFDHFDIQKLYVKYPQYPTNMCVCWISISFEIHSLRSYNWNNYINLVSSVSEECMSVYDYDFPKFSEVFRNYPIPIGHTPVLEVSKVDCGNAG